MDTSKLTGPELLLFLRNDLLPGLNELLSYAEHLPLDPHTRHGLTTRIGALRDDLTDRLSGNL
jgi:hypothetical protein